MKMAIRIHIITGDKGNVGKSTWAAFIVEYYNKCSQNLTVVDADHNNQSLKRIYDNALILGLSDDPQMSTQPDIIFNLAYSEEKKGDKGSDILVDLPASGEMYINRWIEECGLMAISKEVGIQFYKWWVSDADSHSLRLFDQSLKAYPEIKHVFLKNMGRSRPHHWKSFENDSTLQELIKKEKVEILEIPAIDSTVLKILEKESLTLNQVTNDKEHKLPGVGITTWTRVIGFMIRCEKEVQRVLEFTEPQKNSKAIPKDKEKAKATA